MRLSLIVVLFLSLLGLVSCTSEFDVNSDWTPIPVVYCVLDQSQATQYVKVTKAFLGDAPAYVMAQYSDSLFYNDVEVRLYEKNSTGRQLVATFDETNNIPMDTGYFASDRNTLYTSDVTLNPEKEYFLDVQINDIGKTVTNDDPVSLIENCYIATPSVQQAFINIYSYDNNSSYEYYTGTNGKVYQMIIKFYYLEVIGTDTTENALCIEWPQAVKVDSLSNTNNKVRGEFSVSAWYNLLKESIPTQPNVKRLVRMPVSIEYHLVGADENYYTYMQISSPSTGLAQSKPLFTNLSGGIGLFAARVNTVVAKKLGERTLDSLSFGMYMYDKGFALHTDPYYQPHFPLPGSK
ncbi:MAG TPA: DUF4249 family protein [Bacteroidales bacterium]|nr:DUF4249 family protein [Bacteroidales bacterium]HQP05166.1 DUF4249 family protein [Bacteroidales bacterium]